MKTIIAILTLAISFSILPAAQAQDWRCPPGERVIAAALPSGMIICADIPPSPKFDPGTYPTSAELRESDTPPAWIPREELRAHPWVTGTDDPTGMTQRTPIINCLEGFWSHPEGACVPNSDGVLYRDRVALQPDFDSFPWLMGR